MKTLVQHGRILGHYGNEREAVAAAKAIAVASLKLLRKVDRQRDGDDLVVVFHATSNSRIISFVIVDHMSAVLAKLGLERPSKTATKTSDLIAGVLARLGIDPEQQQTQPATENASLKALIASCTARLGIEQKRTPTPKPIEAEPLPVRGPEIIRTYSYMFTKSVPAATVIAMLRYYQRLCNRKPLPTNPDFGEQPVTRVSPELWAWREEQLKQWIEIAQEVLAEGESNG